MTEKKRFKYLFGIYFQDEICMTPYEVLNTLNEQEKTIITHIEFMRKCAEKQGFKSIDEFLRVISDGKITGWRL